MPPKNKGKKGKKADDDFWYAQHASFSSISDFTRDNAGETVPPNLAAPNGGSDGEDVFEKKPKAGFSAFTSTGLTDEIAAEDEDDDGGGGLMVRFIYMIHTNEM
jgi:translation initiation factor 5B